MRFPRDRTLPLLVCILFFGLGGRIVVSDFISRTLGTGFTRRKQGSHQSDQSSKNGARALLFGNKIDFHTASTIDFASIPQVSLSMAQAIVAFREHYGPIRSFSELEKVRGVGKKTIKRIREFVELENSSTSVVQCVFRLS